MKTQTAFPKFQSIPASAAIAACLILGASPLISEELLQNGAFDEPDGLHWQVAEDPGVSRNLIFDEVGQADLHGSYRGPLIWQELDHPVAAGQLIRAAMTLAAGSYPDDWSTRVYLDYETAAGVEKRMLLFQPENSEVGFYPSGSVFETSIRLPSEAERLLRFSVDRAGPGEFWALGFSLTATDAAVTIEINSLEELQKIGVDPEYPLHGSYRLTADIDASATAAGNGGQGWQPIGWPARLQGFDSLQDDPWDYLAGEVFTGRFYGNGYTIENLTIEGDVMQGLFGIVSGGEIHDVILTNVSITAFYAVGGLAGQAGPGSLISNCSVSGTIMGEEIVGGLVGANKGSIFASHSTGTVTSEMPRWMGFTIGGLVGENIEGSISRSFSNAAVAGHAGVGGLVGSNQGGVLEDCYATGSICHLGGGGLLGWDQGGTIRHCYALGVSPSPEECNPEMHFGGALIGAGSDTTSVFNSYWNVQTGYPQSLEGGEGRTSAEMTYPHATNSYVDWDFDVIWLADTEGTLNDGYPVLRELSPELELNLNPTNRTHGAGPGNAQIINVTSSVSWTASRGDANWITLGAVSGDGNGTIAYAVSQNTSVNQRTGTIVVSGGGLSQSFTVTQAGSAAGPWHSGASHLADGWRYYNWFKGFKIVGDWTYHGRHGWLYVVGESTQGMFLWDASMRRWLWINENVYPWMYAYGPNEGWVFFFEGGRPGSRWFRRADTGQLISEQNLRVP